MADRNPRLQIPYLGEHYTDLLKIEAWIKARSAPNEAQSLLCSTLMRRQSTRDKIIDDLARKRGTTREKLISEILTDAAQHMSPEEYAELLADQIED